MTGGNGNLLIWISALFAGFQFILCLVLPELTEVVRKKQKNKSAFMDVIGITYHTMKNAKLRTLILFPSIFAAFTVVIFWMLQPVMELSKVPVYLFGIYIGLNQFSRILASKYAYKICHLFGEIKTSMLSILALVIGIVMSFIALHTSSMPVVYLVIGIMALVPALHKLNDLQYNTLIHDDIDSKERGTILSTRAMVATLFGSAMLSGTKYVYDAYGAEITMLILLFSTVLLIILLNQVKKYICCSK